MLPRSIKVGANVYRVASRGSVELDGNMGVTTHGALLIRINVNQCPGAKRDTVLHESLHAVLDTYGLGRVFDLDDAEEEKLVRALTPALLALLRDNPKLLKFVTGK